MKLLTLLKDLPKHTLTGSGQVKISHLECDSRRVLPGSCYIALKGTQADGHAFIPEAIRRGACAIVAESPCTQEARDGKVSWVEVNDSRLAVSLMGAAWNGHPSRHMSMIGVTGTNGKTTTAYIAHSLLKQSWLRAGLIGTIAYDNGEEITPSTHTTPGPLELEHLLKEMLENGCRGVAMEVSSHALDQERVAGINFTPLYNINHWLNAGLSLDAVYDNSANIYFEGDVPTTENVRQPKPSRQMAAGLSARVEFVMPYFTIDFGVGKNIIGAGGDFSGTYEILALKVDVLRNSFLHIGYSLYDFQKPNYLMLGVGYRFGSKRKWR